MFRLVKVRMCYYPGMETCGRCQKPKPCNCGRPLKFDSVEDLQIQIDLYFADCDKREDTRVWAHDEIITIDGKTVCAACGKPKERKGCLVVSGHLKLPRPYTVSGLALWLNTTRRTLLDYQEKDQFSHTLLMAKQRIENYGEEKLFDPNAPTNGVKFSLSNNWGWADKSIQAQTSVADLIKSQESTTPPDGNSAE
jgi:hypothetical protein